MWVIARQHPGESMAEWFTEGMLHRLLDRHDPVSRKVLAQGRLLRGGGPVPHLCGTYSILLYITNVKNVFRV